MLLLTLALAASQVLATALNVYFQLTIMVMILMLGVVAFAHFRPFIDDLLQRMQVGLSHTLTACFTINPMCGELGSSIFAKSMQAVRCPLGLVTSGNAIMNSSALRIELFTEEQWSYLLMGTHVQPLGLHAV